MNIEGVSPDSYGLLPGAWQDLAQDESLRGQFDTIIMSEVLYN